MNLLIYCDPLEYFSLVHGWRVCIPLARQSHLQRVAAQQISLYIEFFYIVMVEESSADELNIANIEIPLCANFELSRVVVAKWSRSVLLVDPPSAAQVQRLERVPFGEASTPLRISRHYHLAVEPR
tara:strand:- start:47 stop:424 length:378 start_codon:yes stop_codon:yes gene_type:complete